MVIVITMVIVVTLVTKVTIVTMVIGHSQALAGLRKLTDSSSGPRLEPLQEYLIFPIQLYLR